MVASSGSRMLEREVKQLVLHKATFSESVLYKLQKFSTLRFSLGPDLIGEKVRLFTNYASKGEFHRETYYELGWSYSSLSDRTSYYSDLVVTIPGAFHFYFTTTDSKQPHPQEAVGGGYFLVDPEISCCGVPVPLDSLVCQTVLSKLLGPVSTWEEKLEVAYHSGYNMIHFTPIQTLGDSNSAYSLCDQLGLNTTFSLPDRAATNADVEEILERFREKYGIISICDIVLNHTANNTVWLKDQPLATFNMTNSPHLRPAFLLDRAIARMAMDIGNGQWTSKGLAKGRVSSQQDLNNCRDLLTSHYIPQLKIEELFLVDVEKLGKEFSLICQAGPGQPKGTADSNHLEIIQDPEFRRMASTVDLDLASSLINVARPEAKSEEDRQRICLEAFTSTLAYLNKLKRNEVSAHVAVGVDNIFKGAAYERLDSTGPRKTLCDAENEFVTPYFTCPGAKSIEEEMEMMYGSEGGMIMAHNGWVMGDDPLSNFARPLSNVYLRRELIAWGDSVKLRFGESPEDSPFLWEYMKEYTVLTAKLFDGIRLDNCHSTPLHVASYMLDHARRVKPNLYVVAELFTGSEEKDNIFVNHLGITSLIREGLAAWDSHELGRLVYKYGGKPVGAFTSPGGIQVLAGDTAHALFLDWTHDNPSPVEKRTIQDLLPSAGLVSMASCATGSNRGYDELVPHHIHVVNESREYAAWPRLEAAAGAAGGMVAARRELARLHVWLAREGFSEVYVDQLTPDMVAVTRHCPKDRRSVVMVSHTAFSEGGNSGQHVSMEVEGRLEKILLEAKMVRKAAGVKEFAMDDEVINGREDWYAAVRTDGGSDMVKVDEDKGKVKLDLTWLIPGSLVVFSIVPMPGHAEALASISQLDYGRLRTLVDSFGLSETQFCLYQCDQEGREEGFGAYALPNLGSLNYCGLAGLMPILSKMRPVNDLGHPLAANLREGDWLMEYIGNRLCSRLTTKEVGMWTKEAFSYISALPRYLIPAYFDTVVTRLHSIIHNHSLELMSDFVAKGSEFVQMLAQGTAIHLAAVPSAPLPPISTSVAKGTKGKPSPTLAAGLPHFSTGYMRSWGRDTFISLRGLLLTTGLYTEARHIILGYAGCLRHGLIPNLLDGGNNARFNCRDAVWWWLKAILDYVEISPDGESIFDCEVLRLFPSDDQNNPREKKTEPLRDTVHEALTKHWAGLRFREWNAGQRIDEHMLDNGFNNQIGVDPATGFVFGGNVDNCGTWMDKMGSSWEAGNKGRPSSPRDGSAVEIVGLSYACLHRLAKLPAAVYPHQQLEAESTGNGGSITTLAGWAEKIRENFEKHFWIGDKAGAEVEPRPDLVNLTGIYKDSVGSGQAFTDYQLRPNYLIALAVAPELVTPQRAWTSIGMAVKRLMGPLGLATLDSADWGYRGDYDNSNQSHDPTVAHGANYHQGPEWLWPVGFLLRAMLKISALMGPKETAEAKEEIFRILSRHYEFIKSSPWAGLPELTNSKGAHCRDSNPIQAWSHATLLDTLFDIQNMK